MTRTHVLAHAAAVTLFGISATVSQAAIFDRDDRQYVSTAPGSLYSPVGLVTQGTLIEYRSTGFLVDDCHVLTDQAILGYGQAPLGKRLRFTAALGTPQQVTVKATAIAAGGLKRNKTGAEQYKNGGRDWLLLQLDKCVGSTFGYAKLKTGPLSPYEFSNLQSAGYPNDRKRRQGLTLDPSCRVTGGGGISVWLNDCATMMGDGGGPIFRILTSGGRSYMLVYAMQSAGYKSKGPIPLKPGHENQAVPIDLIAAQIQPYLSLKASQGTSAAGELRSRTPNALSQVSGSAGIPSNGSVLGTRVVSSDHAPNSHGGVK